MTTDTKSAFAALSDSMADAAAKAGESTVLVNARRRMPASGIAFAADLVLTADHSLEREEDITVMLPDGSEIAATIAGRDPGSDLAVLRLSRPAATAATPAPAAARVGQLVLALGRPTSEGLQASLGIVSAIGGPARTGRGGLLERYLRTDATPYPGFSGGPLVDATGSVVGFNTSGLGWGASVSIPADLAWQIGAALVKHGHVKRGYLGVRSQEVEIPASACSALGREQTTGLLLVGVEDKSPAAEGGLIVGDILISVAGAPVTDHDELLSRLSSEVVGKPTPIEVLRGGQPKVVTITVGER